MQIRPQGLDGLLVRFALTPDAHAMTAAQAVAAALRDDPPAGVVEIAPALVSVFVRFDAARVSRAELTEALRARVDGRPMTAPEPLRRWTIPACFGGDDGPQLAQVAAKVGVTEQAAIDQICGADLRVLAIGFAPGQPYIGLLPDAWNLPRLSALTPQVPAGAVVVAVRQVVIFGAASPTGWHHVARTAFRSFAPDRDPPMPLRAGDAIRLAPATPSDIAALTDPMSGAQLTVLR
ncbi:allophanate hydrolase subunit 1 [Paracoccus sp. (in: a-proteobacteria)]|uniref:5-oxoprolinase subunit B family protein n=1 Tax=Paracoccus sp. TaxID=267 RepID=UPI0026E09409|nr:carboxyltransferase domain-containing protein [Paracoccus sp. (in: a-proteobacteria)]MDO5647776.1 carboxyltransferase domain-containing protein [Paracoccus sp. (in: a-proteobacteria)]